jgi:branched-chain amino acid aminotransferase
MRSTVKKLRITRASISRLSEEVRESAPFGTVFADHILLANFEDGRWDEPEILPYGPLPLPPAPSALHYGQAVFEGFKAHRTVDGDIAIFRPRDNLARFNRSAARLAMPEVTKSLFLDGIAELVRLDRDWVPHRPGGALYIRPVYFAIDEALQVLPAARYRLVILTSPVGPYFTGTVSLVADEHYVRAFPGGTGDVKPAGNYGGTLLPARDARERGFDNVLWLDGIQHRFVEECGLMNVMFVIDGSVVTPPLTGTILPGIIRDSILTLLRDMGITVEERPIALEELVTAQAAGRLTEAVGVGTAVTIVPIGRISYRDHDIRLKPGGVESIMGMVRSRLEAVRTGREEDAHGWLMRI